MALPDNSELKKGDGGFMRRLRRFFSEEPQVAGRPVGTLKVLIILDMILSYMFIISILSAIVSLWSHFSSNFEVPRSEEFLTESLISAFLVDPSTPKESLFNSLGRGFYCALGIHLLVLICYVCRLGFSSFFLRALSAVDVSSNFRVKACKYWMVCATILAAIDFFALCFNKGIPLLDSVRLLLEILRLLPAVFFVRDFYDFLKDIQQQEDINALISHIFVEVRK